MNPPVVHAEPGASAAEASHHLIGNEQHFVAFAPGTHCWPVIIWGDGGGERCANDRLCNERGDATRPNAVQQRVKLCNRLCAAADCIGPFESCAIRVRGRDVFESTEPRLVRLA